NEKKEKTLRFPATPIVLVHKAEMQLQKSLNLLAEKKSVYLRDKVNGFDHFNERKFKNGGTIGFMLAFPIEPRVYLNLKKFLEENEGVYIMLKQMNDIHRRFMPDGKLMLNYEYRYDF